MRTPLRAVPAACLHRSVLARLQRSLTAVLVALAAIAGLTLAYSPPAAAVSRETFAGITCTDAQFGGWNTKYKGWGVDYPHSRQIKIVLKVFGTTGALVATKTTTLTTSGTGSWSTPTYSGSVDAEFGGNEPIELYVATQIAPNGAFIDDAGDTC